MLSKARWRSCRWARWYVGMFGEACPAGLAGIALNCTPDDLFNWTPGKAVKSPKKLALSKLAGRKRNGIVTTKLKDLPEHKIEELHQFLNKLTSSD